MRGENKSRDLCAVRLFQVWLYHWTRLTANVLLRKHNTELVMAQTPFELQDCEGQIVSWDSCPLIEPQPLGLLKFNSKLVMARSRGVTALAGSLAL